MSSRTTVPSSSPMIETLESRQLMSLTVDLRLPGGGKAANVTGVGQVINLEVWATVKGANSSTSDESLQIAVGSLLSTNVNGGAANGTLKAKAIAPFASFGSQTGASKDLDGDGDLDVGSNVPTDGSSFFAVRSASMTGGSSFKIGTATFTVTSLKSTTGQTNLVFRTRTTGGTGALWEEDNNQKREYNGSYVGGSALVLKRGGSTGTGGRIAGILWSDTDKDKVIDSGEPRLGGKKMFLDSNKNGKLDTGEKTAITSSTGDFAFTGLAAGSYRVRRADTPTGYGFSTPSVGFYDVTLSTNQQVSGKNFGAIPISGTTGARISGIVFSDNDKDGILDSTDTRLGGKKMYVDGNKNGKFDAGEKTATTSSSGEYVFSGLAAGSYRIRRADTPAGYVTTVPSVGFYDITIGSGASISGKNFGFKLA